MAYIPPEICHRLSKEPSVPKTQPSSQTGVGVAPLQWTVSGTATRGLADAYAKYSSMEISESSQLDALAINNMKSDRFVFSASQSDEVSWSRWFPDFGNFAGLATVAFASTWLEAEPKTTMQELLSKSRRLTQQLSLDMSSIQTPDFETTSRPSMTVEEFFK